MINDNGMSITSVKVIHDEKYNLVTVNVNYHEVRIMVRDKRRKKSRKETTSCQCMMSHRTFEKWNLRTNSNSLR